MALQVFEVVWDNPMCMSQGRSFSVLPINIRAVVLVLLLSAPFPFYNYLLAFFNRFFII
jgi:hypothetical protein